MLLDSDTALKVAHDIIHDSGEFFKKWALLLARPDAESEVLPAREGYVEFTYADGSIERVPCVWAIVWQDDGAPRESISARRDGMSGTLGAGGVRGSFGVVSNSPIAVGTLTAKSLEPAPGDPTGTVTVIDPGIDKIEGNEIEIAVLEAEADSLNGDGAFALYNNYYNDIDAGGCDADLDSLVANSVGTEMLICTGEEIAPAQKINAWNPVLIVNPPETDGQYTGAIPFHALSESGEPINGFGAGLAENPFYPDWIYVAQGPAPWKPRYAWVPSEKRPSEPYWLDSDGIYWYKSAVASTASRFGSTNLVWPIRTVADASSVEWTTPPMKADADGMVVTVKVLMQGEAYICVSDRYDLKGESTWTWTPGELRTLEGPGIYMFIVKRNLIWSRNKITGVEYQFLSMGD